MEKISRRVLVITYYWPPSGGAGVQRWLKFVKYLSMSGVGTDGEFYKTLSSSGVPNATELAQSLPAYWGPQPMTSGPVYLGAIVVFLFFFGMFFLRGSLKWWLLGVTVLAILLACWTG